MKTKLLMPLVLLTVLSLPVQARAHSVQTDYLLNVQQDLEITSTFSTDEPFKHAKIQVYAPGNPTEPVFEGTTDAQGQFAFQPDKTRTGDWEIHIGEGGHMDILTVPVNQGGVDVDAISATPPQRAPHTLLWVGATCIAGSLVTLRLRTRDQDD